MNKKLTIGLLLMVLVVVGIFFIVSSMDVPTLERGATSRPLNDPSEELLSSDIDPLNGEESLSELEFSSPDIDNQTELSSQADNTEQVQTNTAKEHAELDIELALNGDEKATVRVAQLINQCRSIPGSRANLKRQLQLMARQPGAGLEIQDGIGRVTAVDSIEEWEKIQNERMRNCLEVHDIFQPDFREELRQLALNGSVVARYLYAMWPPEREQDNAEAFLATMEYEYFALQFTWQNLIESEPLALLAFGQSYSSSQFFTPLKPMESQSFLLAAKQCGLNLEWLDSAIGGFESVYEPAFGQSAVIVKNFCK